MYYIRNSEGVYMKNKKSSNPSKWTETQSRAWIGLVKAQQSLVSKVEAELKKAGFPQLSWYDVLWELESAKDGSLRLNEIGSRVLLDKYNVTRLIHRLEEEGLVSRSKCPVDGRGVFACITDKGKRLRRQMWEVYEKVVRENFLTKYNRKELIEFKNFIERLHAGVREEIAASE